jgi:2-polyprenyl-3-methyl-5-hydroxy-6-metoxy-1,4-benzoquinol methylase
MAEVAGGDLASTVNENEAFECIVCREDVWGEEMPDRCAKRLLGMIRPGGRLVACVPNPRHYSVLLGLIKGAQPSLRGADGTLALRGCAMRPEFEGLLEDAGWTMCGSYPVELPFTGANPGKHGFF